MTLTPEQQLEELKTRALAAKGTPAEATFQKLIASLEEQIEKSNLPPQQIAPDNPQAPKKKSQAQTAYFQGIGTIYGKITPLPDNPGRYTIKSGQYQFPLSVPLFLKEKVHSAIGKSANLRVYPQVNLSKKAENNYRLSFRLTWINISPKSEDAGLFTLRGIWQILPQYPNPVISVYRNQSRGKKDKCQPQHIPLLWKKPPVPPFQYDPNKTKQDPRYFCQVRAKLRPKLQTFEVLDILGEPTKKIPKYIKPKKQKHSPKAKPTDRRETKSSLPEVVPTARKEPDIIPNKSEEEELMAIAARMEVTLKINEFPDEVKTVENGWKQFELDCDGRIVTVKVLPKMFRKLEEARDNYPMWVAAISGKMGANTKQGFILEQPSIQAFERKPKPPKEG